MKKNKILLVSSELYPYTREGDLGEFVKLLCTNFYNYGLDVRVFLPLYKKVLEDNILKLEKLNVYSSIITNNNAKFNVKFWVSYLNKKFPVYFVENDFYFGERHKIYGYIDDPYRFTFFNLAVVQFLLNYDWVPEIVHNFDWHTALLSCYLKFNEKLRNIKNVFTINNINYQGIVEKDILDFANLPQFLFDINYLEFFGKINLLKSGIICSDIITTHSELYAKEIQTIEEGAGLHGLLQSRNKYIKGIINGIDTNKYNPELNDILTAKYNYNNIYGKQECKKILQKELEIPINSDIPILVINSNDIEQSAYNILIFLAEYLKRLDLQIIIIEPKLNWFENKLQENFIKSNCIVINVPQNYRNNVKLWSGADIYLSLSKNVYTKELLLALRFGVVPIVYGNKDVSDNLIINFNKDTNQGNGFIYYNFNPIEIINTFKNVYDTYNKVAVWNNMVKNCLKVDVSINTTIKKYMEIYETL